MNQLSHMKQINLIKSSRQSYIFLNYFSMIDRFLIFYTKDKVNHIFIEYCMKRFEASGLCCESEVIVSTDPR